MTKKNWNGEMHIADVLEGQLLFLLEGELKNVDSSYCSPASTRLPAGNLSPEALAWHMLNETLTLVNMAAVQEKARPASPSKWCL